MNFTKVLLLILPMAVCGYARADAPNPKILVAYYSLTGKTEKVAQAIADASGFDYCLSRTRIRLRQKNQMPKRAFYFCVRYEGRFETFAT